MKIGDFLKLFKEGKVSARSHMKNLIEMAMVDGSFDDVEYNLLKKIANRHNISERQLKEIQDNMAGISFEVPDTEKEKFDQLYDLVHMMTVDNYIDSEEVRLCSVFAKKFGYDVDHANELVTVMAENIKNGQKPEETLKRVEWMLN